jgi:hypothetical protein
MRGDHAQKEKEVFKFGDFTTNNWTCGVMFKDL